MSVAMTGRVRHVLGHNEGEYPVNRYHDGPDDAALARVHGRALEHVLHDVDVDDLDCRALSLIV
jgi:hypothetical protein